MNTSRFAANDCVATYNKDLHDASLDLAANGDLRLSGRQLLPARIRLREWDAWAATTGHAESGLPEFLAHRISNVDPSPTADHWRRWMRQSEVLLLLGDEIARQKTDSHRAEKDDEQIVF